MDRILLCPTRFSELCLATELLVIEAFKATLPLELEVNRNGCCLHNINPIFSKHQTK